MVHTDRIRISAFSTDIYIYNLELFKKFFIGNLKRS